MEQKCPIQFFIQTFDCLVAISGICHMVLTIPRTDKSFRSMPSAIITRIGSSCRVENAAWPHTGNIITIPCLEGDIMVSNVNIIVNITVIISVDFQSTLGIVSRRSRYIQAGQLLHFIALSLVSVKHIFQLRTIFGSVRTKLMTKIIGTTANDPHRIKIRIIDTVTIGIVSSHCCCIIEFQCILLVLIIYINGGRTIALQYNIFISFIGHLFAIRFRDLNLIHICQMSCVSITGICMRMLIAFRNTHFLDTTQFRFILCRTVFGTVSL